MGSEPEQAEYARAGYVIAAGLLTAAEVDALNRAAEAVVHAADPAASIDGVLALHFPHKLDDRFRAAMHHAAIVDRLTRLVGPDVKAIQSMLFIKGAGQPGQAWHQDEAFLPTRDRSLCGVWIALDDATIDNGCLWVHPGSHASGVLWPMVPHGDPRFDASAQATGFPYDGEGGVALAVAAGDAVFFNGYLLHRSLPNRRSAGFRRALVIHYMRAQSLLPWNHDDHSPTDDFRDIEMVAGVDPYAWKGIADSSRPFIRATSPS